MRPDRRLGIRDTGVDRCWRIQRITERRPEQGVVPRRPVLDRNGLEHGHDLHAERREWHGGWLPGAFHELLGGGSVELGEGELVGHHHRIQQRRQQGCAVPGIAGARGEGPRGTPQHPRIRVEGDPITHERERRHGVVLECRRKASDGPVLLWQGVCLREGGLGHGPQVQLVRQVGWRVVHGERRG